MFTSFAHLFRSTEIRPLCIFILKSHWFFKVQLKHHLPSEVFPDHSQKISLPLQQIYASSSRKYHIFILWYVPVDWELIHLCLHHPPEWRLHHFSLNDWLCREVWERQWKKDAWNPGQDSRRKKSLYQVFADKVEKRQLSGGFTNHPLPPFGLVTWVTQALAAGGTCKHYWHSSL